MYIVEITNGQIATGIHGNGAKLKSGTVVKGINAIDSFSFVVFPSNPGFSKIHDFQTLVSVYNTNRKRYEFRGRVLYSRDVMEADGHITKEVTCESCFGFLCDSQQEYKEEQNWTVQGLLEHIINTHNSQVEGYKQFTLGEITVEDPNDNLYVGVQRQNTWDTIQEKLIGKLGGEIRFRVVDGKIFIDYLKEIGETKTTKIALSHNMKSISKENDPTAYVTRLIPLGCKLKVEETSTDDNGNETTQIVESEERLDISSVNGGVKWIDDEDAIEAYGVHVGYIEFDDVTDASNLLRKGKEWLVENNKVQVKYSISALDLSLLGLDIDDLDVHNYHPVENSLLAINDVARIIKKNIDVCEEVKSTIEVGDNFKTLSDIQIEQAGKLDTATNTIQKIESNYVTNQVLASNTETLNSLIQQRAESIIASITAGEVTATPTEEYRQHIETQLALLSQEILMKFTTTSEQISSVDGDLQSKFTQLYKYISFSGDTAITIGSGDSSIVLEIDNEKGIVFKRNGIRFGLWDGENFYTGNIVVEVNERAQFGNFAFVPRSDGSLSFLKVGG